MPDIVIVKWPKGYVAHVRYGDRYKDIDISHSNYKTLHWLVARYVKENS